MRYFLTGHTGFKGAWLTLLLTESGHSVSGLSLNPSEGALFSKAEISQRISKDLRGDIREAGVVLQALRAAAPDVVVHLAAQPLVRESYEQPRLTLETNVNGTFNVLEAVSQLGSVQAQLMVTTDKVYRNTGHPKPYHEDDPLGGNDPYSASKSMADILIASWTQSFSSPPTAIARAGNVVGGGDTSKDRLLPDLMQCFAANETALIRYPSAVRPWQHVLDCLSGYVLLVERLLSLGSAAEAWNFGPDPSSFASVRSVSEIAAHYWGPGAVVEENLGSHLPESEHLSLDSGKARDQLGWRDRLSLEEAIEWTVRWTRCVAGGGSALRACLDDIDKFNRL